MNTATLSAQPATKQNLALRFGRSKSVIAVDSIKEASDAWCRLRDERNLGASESPASITVVDTATGKTVARISYNGRAWAPDGTEIEIE